MGIFEKLFRDFDSIFKPSIPKMPTKQFGKPHKAGVGFGYDDYLKLNQNSNRDNKKNKLGTGNGSANVTRT